MTDENGHPAEGARVGARVWNEQLVRQSGEQPVVLADAVRAGAGEVLRQIAPGSSPAPQQQLLAGGSNRALSEQRVPSNEQTQLTGRVLGDLRGQPAAIVLPESIELVSNLEAVKAAIREAASAAESHRRQTMEAIGGAAVFGGIAVLLLLGMLVVLRMAASARVAAPVFATALVSLLLGISWLGWLPPSRFAQIAMAPAASSAAAIASDESKSATDRIDELAAQPPTPAAPSTPAPDAPLSSTTAAPSKTAGAPAEPSASPATIVAPPAAAQNPESTPAAGALQAGRPDTAEAAAAQVRPSDPADAKSSLRAAPLSRAEAPPRSPNLEQQGRGFSSGGRSPAPGPATGLGTDRAGVALGRPTAPSQGAVADKQAAEGSSTKKSFDDLAKGKSEGATAPAALYFNPQLVTDANGRATIRFIMPSIDSEYRLLIDALGQGRIGSRQELLICGAAAAK